MTTHVELRSGSYHDSVSLMQASAQVSAVPSVQAAIVAMATPLNIELYARLGFPPEAVASADPNDLLVAVQAADDATVSAALARLEAALTASGSRSTSAADVPRRTTATALRDGGDVVIVSVPGAHAFVEAMDAVRAGASVFLFSDNVPVEQEVALKQAAVERGVLVMGPDCGTAVVGGVGLGFANVLRPGPVGIVAASGTGAQQVTCLLDAAGVGVSAVLGLGGRDLSEQVRGRSATTAMQMLDRHPGTELIVLLSKPPHPDVAGELREVAAGLSTPTMVSPIGRGQDDLTVITEKVLATLGRSPVDGWREWPAPAPRKPRNGFVRGLFGGGTLCDEAMVIASERLGPVASNIPLDPAWALGPDLRGTGHVMIDFGDDALTQGRAHPMIDPSLRLERIAAEAADPSCAVLLLDVELGSCSHPDPAGAIAPAVADARATAAAAGRDLAVVVSLCAAAGDAQGLERTAEAFVAAGASVHLSNAAAARIAAALASGGGAP